MNFQEAKAAWEAHSAIHEQNGAYFPGAQSYLPDEYRNNFSLAMDAQPALSTTTNGGIPAYLTYWTDPKVFKVLFAPNKAATILGEVRKGSLTDTTALFPTVEHTGEISSYDDFAENGRTGVNTVFPQRQNYIGQTMKEYGDLELERAGLARINWVSELDVAAATVVNKFLNLSYVFGIGTVLQNYGMSNDPALNASLTPAAKAYGGVKWVNNGQIVATAGEVYADIQALYLQLVIQTGSLVEEDSEMVLVVPTQAGVALTATNSFNVNVSDLLKKNFPKLTIETMVQYNAYSASNPQGIQGGNFVQLIVKSIDGQETGYAAFSEKMRAGRIIPATSSFKQKVSFGTWGAIIRQPANLASMIGV